MPELPEVETSRRGITPHLLNQTIDKVVIREFKLRWPIPRKLASYAQCKTINTIERRGKYLLLRLDNGTIIIHLGMSGSLRICDSSISAEKHDHMDIVCKNGKILRLKDPRKFGCVLWTKDEPLEHKLLVKLGPEPLTKDFNTDSLYLASRKRTCSIKSFIMNGHIVVGVGNIYACESLFMSGINPKRKAGSLSKARYEKLVANIKQILKSAIRQGGTTLKDFTREDGKPGYFAQKLNVYGRAGEACVDCKKPLKQITQQQRSTFYCSHCQR
jgi:formamidopyrimidine-DNA glycosylase